MFKVPDWEEDKPNSNINIKKKSNNFKIVQKNETKSVSPKKIRIANPVQQGPKVFENKSQVKKQKLNRLIINNKKNKLLRGTTDVTKNDTVKTKKKTFSNPLQQEIKVEEKKSKAKKRKVNGQTINDKETKLHNGIDISKIDTDKADEILLDAEKKKFYKPIEKDDQEDLLFSEAPKVAKTHVSLSSTGKILSKVIDKKTQKRKKHRDKKTKNNIVSEFENEIPKNVFQVTENNSQIQHIDSKHSSRPINKEKLKAMLKTQSHRNTITVTGNKLRERMLDRLKAAQFRYLNEKLYTSSGAEAKQLFQSDPAAFHTYHQGYQQQLKKWPVNPLDVIVKRIQAMPKSHVIADMGCGEAALSRRVPHAVRSFDLVSAAPGVTSCDMAHTPLLAASVDVVVYCLALMGTELTQYLLEANRVLNMGGHLLIAEVESRFEDVDSFTKEVMKLGFKLKKLDKKHKVFFFMEFTKIRDPPVKKSKLPNLTLKPCLYKRR